MTDIHTENLNETGLEKKTGGETRMNSLDQGLDQAPRTTAGNFREASYVVLFIAAVFVINAMETGSYRTPWPVAIVTAIVGFGLLGYSFLKKTPPAQ